MRAEADEHAHENVQRALFNLTLYVQMDGSYGVVSLYEQAARALGATAKQIASAKRL